MEITRDSSAMLVSGPAPTPPLPPDLRQRPIRLTENARTVLQKRYLRRGEDGKPVEDEHEMFWRVAYHVALAEEQHNGDVLNNARKFYDLLTNLQFFPNSPTFTGAGTPLGQLAACFVLPIEDDMGRSEAGIFQTLRNAALIQQTGGGNGFSFSHLRPKGALVRSSNGQATGPIGFLRVYDQAFGEIAQGGCLTPDTLVFTERGLLRLDEIVTHSEPGWRPHDLSVPTDEGTRASTQAYNNGIVPVLRVSTDAGLELTGTPNHKLKVMTAAGPAWRRFDELQPGDAILVKLGQHMGQTQSLLHPVRQHGNQVIPDFPSVLDEEFAFFLGCMAGDGFVAAGEDDHRIGISVAHDSYLIDEMPALMKRLFGAHLHVHRQQKENDASVTFVLDNCAIKDFLILNDLVKARSTNARVPRSIRQSSPNVVGAFLSGLFEADGALSHGYPQLLSSSETLIREVATLLIGLGCPVRVHQHTIAEGHYGQAPLWIIRINSYIGLQAWRKNIGCDSRSRFNVCYTHEPDLARESSYMLPHAKYWVEPILTATALPQIDARGTGRNLRATSPKLRKQLLRYTRGDRDLTISGYARLTEQSPAFAEHARPINDMWFVVVNDVTDAGESLTLDIEVEGNHTYLANGLVSHNSRRGANMAVLQVNHPDIREFITCKTNESHITNFNISVGITDDFMRAVEADSDFDLINPQDGSVWETVRAREIFELIVKQAHHNGEPGVLFLDTANRQNPVPHLYELESTNPCVTGDTLVATPTGWRRADSIGEGDEICTVLGTGKVATVEVNEAVPVFAIHFSDGGTIKATASHQFHVRSSKTKFFEPKCLDQLETGDWVRVYKTAIPSNPVPQGTITLEDRHYGFLVGVLVGDGCYTPRALSKNVVRISSNINEHAWNKILQDAFEEVAPAGVYSYAVEGSNGLIRDPKPRRTIADWVRSLPLEPATGPQKTLPDAFINSNYEFLTGLLDGLFSTDGSIDLSSNHPLVRFHTSSEKLAQQVRLILLMFGVHGRVCKSVRKQHDINGREIRHDRPKYDVVISGQSFGRFFEQIRLSHPDKQHRMEEAALSCNFTGGNWAAQVVSIEPAGVERVYDLYEPRSDTWITEGYVSRGCGEQFLGPFENCCLGSINLVNLTTADRKVDWDLLQKLTEDSTRFLDDVVTANKYVPAVPQLEQAAHAVRRIGLGIMGLGDLMYKLGVRYGSEEGQEFAGQIMEFVRFHAMRTSIKLAKKRGAFTEIKGSIYDPANLKWQPPKPLFPYTRDWDRPEIDWSEITDGIRKHGIRNGAQLTVAPTGTIATVSGCEAYGCEPVFALAYVRHVNDKGRDLQLQYTSPLFQKALEEAGLSAEQIKAIVEEVNAKGSCQDVAVVPEHVRHTFVVSSDISVEEHIRMQAAMQAFVDNAISKTVNAPATATLKDVETAYMLGWKLGCKGMTVYVTGSRETVVLETHATVQAKQKDGESSVAIVSTIDTIPAPVPEPPPKMHGYLKKQRPRELIGKTYQVGTPLGKTYVTINENGEGRGQPFEIFTHTSKAGSETAAVSEAIGRLISLILRFTSPISPRERLAEIIEQLQGIGGGRSSGFGAARVRSLPDGIAQVLQEYMEATENGPAVPAEPPPPTPIATTANGNAQPHVTFTSPKLEGDLCPECGEAAVVNEEGCRKCYNCGYSEC